MTSTLFTRAYIVCIMALLPLFGVPAWATDTNIQQQRDAQLIDAIKLNDTNSVIRLLTQGANPNAQYVPMSVQEIVSADLQKTWPLRPRHTNLGQLHSKPTASKRHGTPSDQKLPVSALIVALDVTLDCASDISLAPRHSALIKALVQAGANVNAHGDGHTPLLLAMTYNRRDIVSLLLARGADIFARNDYGNTSLMGAAGMGDVNLTRSLLKQGLEVNARNKFGMTALMCACYSSSHLGDRRPQPRRSDDSTVQVLLEHGADVNARLKDGTTTLTLAKWYANAKIVFMLKKAGAK